MFIGWDVGIKNLAYCIIDYKLGEDGKPIFEIVDWGIINLMIHKKEDEFCNCLKTDGELCGKKANYESENISCEINKKLYCKTHYKKELKCNPGNIIKEIYDKLICCKCSKNASRYDNLNNKYYCTKHGKDIEGSNCDIITQTKATKMPLYTLGKILFRKLDENPNFLNVKYICIENQPVLKNPTMKSIQMMLYSYFVMKAAHKLIDLNDIVLMSAKNKLKIYNNEYGIVDNKISSIKDKYRRNKKMGIEHTKLYLDNEHINTEEGSKWRDYFYNNKSKNDDLADAYLMSRYYVCKLNKLMK